MRTRISVPMTKSTSDGSNSHYGVMSEAGPSSTPSIEV